MDYFAPDLPGIRTPKEDQMGLQFKYGKDGQWSMCFNYSKKIEYLKKKMTEHYRDQKLHHKDQIDNLFYRIIDKDNNIFFEHSYIKGIKNLYE